MEVSMGGDDAGLSLRENGDNLSRNVEADAGDGCGGVERDKQCWRRTEAGRPA